MLVAFALPWRIWLAIQSPPQNQPAPPISDAIRPGFLIDRLGKLDNGLQALLRQAIEQGRYSWVIPAFLVVAVASLWDPARRRVAAFYLRAVGLDVRGARVGVLDDGERELPGVRLDDGRPDPADHGVDRCGRARAPGFDVRLRRPQGVPRTATMRSDVGSSP